MASFTVRVQLLGVKAGDEVYEKLHEIVQAKGLTRTITDDEGLTYELPFGVYNFVGTADRAAVLDKAKSAVAMVAHKGRILVTESKGRTWSNLDKA